MLHCIANGSVWGLMGWGIACLTFGDLALGIISCSIAASLWVISSFAAAEVESALEPAELGEPEEVRS